jgi:hypothetical protein
VRSITATKAAGSSGVNLDDREDGEDGEDGDDRVDNGSYFPDRAEHKFRTTLDLPNRSVVPLVLYLS